MVKLIKSYIAHRNWIKAHSFMGNISPDLALVAIRRSVKIEPDESVLPKYLELKGNIELNLGYTDLAKQTFLFANEILKKNPENFKTQENSELRKRILISIDEITNMET